MRRLILLKDYLLKSPICHSFPNRLVIETTARCNLRCKMCLRTLSLKRRAGDMDLATFRNIIAQGKGKLEFVSLQGYGEPLLNPQIFTMIKLGEKMGIRTGISTNATVLDTKTALKLIECGLSHLTFAFDGATKKTYEDIRRGANFEKVNKNIENFLKLKNEASPKQKKLGVLGFVSASFLPASSASTEAGGIRRRENKKKSKIFVVLQCIYMRETAEEIDRFKKQWKIRGVDALRIRQITQSVSRYDKKTRKKFLNRQDAPCFWLWTEPTVFWDGTVVPCCQDVNAQMSLGNINKGNLLDIWNSQKMQKIRQAHREGKRNKIAICKDCNMYQPTLPLAIGSCLFNVFTLNKMVPWLESFISFLRYR